MPSVMLHFGFLCATIRSGEAFPHSQAVLYVQGKVSSKPSDCTPTSDAYFSAGRSFCSSQFLVPAISGLQGSSSPSKLTWSQLNFNIAA